MTRISGLFLRFFVITLSLMILWFNVGLYLAPAVPPDFETVPRHSVAHLAWIKEKLVDGAGDDMQRLFPEGYFFSYLLYGLAWIEIGLRSAEPHNEAIREARWALAQLESAAGKAAFPAELPPGHGMFYAGWRNHLQAGIVLLAEDQSEVTQLRARCDALVDALTHSTAWPWLASYHNQVWPCDTPPGIHALSVYDEVTGEDRYADFISRWVSAVNRNLCPEFEMITHLADPSSGKPVGPPRGTSQTIILRFLADIDPNFASEQYERFQRNFQGDLLGVPAILEYPNGSTGFGDVDSGPLIGGFSASATVVGMGVAQIYGDREFSQSISQLSEVIGLPLGIDRRRYLGGVLPVGDCFVVHATTARPWLARASDLAVQPTTISLFWRWAVHVPSILLGILLVLLWRLASPKPRKSDHSQKAMTSTNAAS